MLNQLWNDEAGLVISAELVLVMTIAVLATIVGLSEVAVAVNTEINDVSNAIGAMGQTFAHTGFLGFGGKLTSVSFGSRYVDTADDCDTNTSCDLVTPALSIGESIVVSVR